MQFFWKYTYEGLKIHYKRKKNFRDHGLPLRCRAEVPGLHGAEEDSITMHVACKLFVFVIVFLPVFISILFLFVNFL